MKIIKGIGTVLQPARLLLITGIGAICLLGCNPRESQLQQEHANSYVSQEELEGYKEWVQTQENYTSTHQDLLKKVDNRIELLEKKMDSLSLEKQAQVREDVKHLEAQRVLLQNKLSQLNQATEQNWAPLKQEVESIADSLSITLERTDKNVEFGTIWMLTF